MLAKGDTRNDLLATIKEHPGLHFRELQRRTGFATGQLEYHLYQLERELLIAKRKDGKLLRFFSNVTGDSFDRQIIFYLRNRISREILTECLAHEGVARPKQAGRWKKQNEYATQLQTMLSEGLIIEEAGSLKVRDTQKIMKVLEKYRMSFIDTMAAAIISLLGP